jgi:lactoylglutathione lyase
VDLALPVPTFAEVDAAYQQATSRGARAVRPPGLMPWGQRIALIADPDGNLVEFFSDTP